MDKINNITRIFKIFDHKDKLKILFLFTLNILTGIFELLGIASILPFVGLISNPEFFIEYPFFKQFFADFNLTHKQLTIYTGISIIILFILSNLTSAFNLWKTVQFTAYQSHKISLEVMQTYFNQPYYYFTNTDFSTINKNILSESSLLAENFLMPLLQIITKLTILISISFLLVYVDSVAFIYSLIFLLLLYLLIYKNIRKLVIKYGKERIISNDQRFKYVNDSLKSIKDIKFYNVESFYLDGFSISQNNFLIVTAKNTLFGILPKYLIEIFAIGGLFTIIIVLISTNSNLALYLPTIALFVLAAYRILPLMQQIFVNITTMKFYLPSLNVLENIRQLSNEKTMSVKEKIKFNKQISFKNVSFSHKDKKILDKISFNIPKGNITGILGKTGVGKTTILDLLLGFLFPNNGKILVDNINITKENYRKVCNISGYVAQNISFLDNSIASNIALGIPKDKINYKLIKKLIDCVMLSDLIDSLKDGVNSSMGEGGVKLSGGQCQRIGIARALYLSPEVLVLDEATNALDSNTEEKIIKNIKSMDKNITIIIISHRLSTTSLYNNLLVLNKSNMLSFEEKDINLNQIKDIIK